jgi:hypothetical protein
MVTFHRIVTNGSYGPPKAEVLKLWLLAKRCTRLLLSSSYEAEGCKNIVLGLHAVELGYNVMKGTE